MNIFIGLGSNIESEANLQKAAAMLRSHFPTICFSSVYTSSAREVEDQDDFLNAVAACETEKSPEEIQSILRTIEQSLGKAPPYRFGPRTIDLDLLLYGDHILKAKDLTVPHPRMHERRFVLEPLCELINDNAMHPKLKQSWQELLDRVQDQECMKISTVL